MLDARVIARDRRDTLGEGPLWSARENAVYWVDILGKRLNRLSLADKKARDYRAQQMDKHFFGGGADAAAGYVPPAKS